ncbi:MAG TPA: glycosyltransferase family 92 protein, partial [Acetobacteraceae bacterium]|nr:glycosyltransferase family 92 protein [Acetobacteraceae bacterium]
MDRMAVCAIFKDEAAYLLEWIAFHSMIGVDHFVLYENGSTDGGPELIRGSRFAGNVTLIEWADRPGQLSAYQ